MHLNLIKNNYLHLPNFLTRQEAQELAQAFEEANNQGLLVLDSQCPSSPASYNLMPCVKMLVKKIPEISKLCNQEVLPTYAYGRIYTKGEILHRHRDRDACEISVTVNLQHNGPNWPIYIQKPNGEEISLNLNFCDAMMYLGCEADHWRDAYEGNCHTQVFFHYVLANGTKAYAFFDREIRQ